MLHHKFADHLPDFSRLIYGVWRLGDDVDTTTKHILKKVETCLDQGITTFDHADIYGDYVCEKLFGDALKEAPSLKQQMQIITKCDIMLVSEKYPDRRVKYYDTSAAHIAASVDASLANIGVDAIDMLLLHRPDPFMDHHETGVALDGLIAAGKIKSAGVSNFKSHDWNLLQSAMKNQLVCNQIEISLLERSAFTNGDIAFLQERGIAPMAWSPLAGGGLFDAGNHAGARLMPRLQELASENDVGVDAIAFAWLLAHPAGICPVIGTNNINRVARISECLNVSIDRETWFELYTLAEGNEVP